MYKKLLILLILALTFSFNAVADVTSTTTKCRVLLTGASTFRSGNCYSNEIWVDKTVTTLTHNVLSDALVTDNIFAPTSFWYQDISKAPIDANSTNLTAEFNRQVKAYYGNVSINTTSGSSPVYIASATDAKVDIAFNDCQKKGYADAGFVAMMKGVPVPAAAEQANGGDAEMTIYDPATKSLWETWVTKKDAAGNWSACWGGKIANTTLSDGVFPSYYGTTATSLPFIGGQITAEELARGEIKHALGISLVDQAAWNVFSYPAHRSDGYNPTNAPNRIAEGQRFRLDPTVNVDALNMSKAAKTIAKAAQKYGFVVWDKAGAVTLRAQNALTYTAKGLPNPYPALYENKYEYQVLNGFPWDKLQFMPMNYGKP